MFIITIVLRAVFYNNDKYYLQVFLDECLHEIWMGNNELKKLVLKIVHVIISMA